MVSRTIVTLTCDVCGSEDMVESHQLVVDNLMVNGEACMKCWGKVAKGIEAFLRGAGASETPQRKNGRRKQVA